METTNDDDYICLRAWNRFLQAPLTYGLDRARSDGAPPTAIYRKNDGGWATYEGITNPDAKRAIDAILTQWGYL